MLFLRLLLVLAACRIACLSNRANAGVIFTSVAGNSIMHVDNSGVLSTLVGPPAGTGTFYGGLATDSSGRLYASVTDGTGSTNRVEYFQPDGTSLGTFASSGLSQPLGLDFDSSGNLVVANSLNDTLRKFAPDGTDLGNLVTGLNINPESVGFDPSGNIYVTLRSTNRVDRFSSSGAFLGTFAGTGIADPSDLVFDSSGNLYISGRGSNNVRVYSATGADLGDFLTGLNGPASLDIDDMGNFLVGDREGLYLYGPSGILLDTLFTGAVAEVQATPTAVPEPASISLFMLGACPLLVYSRKKKGGRLTQSE